jgi:hypothetical protein
MLALEIRLNGDLKATCGIEDADALAASLHARRNDAAAPKDFGLYIECMGVRPVDADTREVLKWVSARVRLGDEVTLRFVETSQVQEPIDRQVIPARGSPTDA